MILYSNFLMKLLRNYYDFIAQLSLILNQSSDYILCPSQFTVENMPTWLPRLRLLNPTWKVLRPRLAVQWISWILCQLNKLVGRPAAKVSKLKCLQSLVTHSSLPLLSAMQVCLVHNFSFCLLTILVFICKIYTIKIYFMWYQNIKNYNLI